MADNGVALPQSVVELLRLSWDENSDGNHEGINLPDGVKNEWTLK